MQTMSQPQLKISTETIRQANLKSDFYHHNSSLPDSDSQHHFSLKNYRAPKSSNSKLDLATEPNYLLQRNGFSIHLVDSLKQCIKASTLIKRMYASRGYCTESNATFSLKPNQFTFLASIGGITAGTVTLGVDSDEGLLADELYGHEINSFRREGSRVCELSKFALDPQYSSKEMIASLFQVAYAFAHDIHKATDFFCEVNPRHAGPQKRMFGFRQIGNVRTCPRVNAPAVLLHLELEFIKNQINSLAGLHKENTKNRSLYSYFSQWPNQRVENSPRATPFNQRYISAFQAQSSTTKHAFSRTAQKTMV